MGGCPGWSESSLGAHSFCRFVMSRLNFLFFLLVAEEGCHLWLWHSLESFTWYIYIYIIIIIIIIIMSFVFNRLSIAPIVYKQLFPCIKAVCHWVSLFCWHFNCKNIQDIVTSSYITSYTSVMEAMRRFRIKTINKSSQISLTYRHILLFRKKYEGCSLISAIGFVTRNSALLTVCPAKNLISLDIRPVWPESSLFTQWVAKDRNFLHADSEVSDQTGQMPFVGFVMRRF